MNPHEAAMRAYLRRTLGFAEPEIDGLIALGRTSLAKALAELEGAAGAGDPGRLSDAAHAVKGMLRNMGLEDLAAMARDLENTARTGEAGVPAEAVSRLRGQLDPFLRADGPPGEETPPPMDREGPKA